jgi:hypothetical protein
VAIDFTPASGRQRRAGAALPRTRQPGQPREQQRYMPAARLERQLNGSRPQHGLLDALAELPPARQGPVFRAGHATAEWLAPAHARRRPAPLVSRLLAGEFQRRLVLSLVVVTIFVVVITALGASLFS